MTIIQSTHDFDSRILFNSPLLFLLHITNPALSAKIYNKQTQNVLCLQQKTSNTTKFENHEIAIRTQYFLEWRLLSICFLITIFCSFSLNPLLLFFVAFAAEQEGRNLESFHASLIFPCFYGSCILSLVIWVALYRLPLWNMGVVPTNDATQERNERMQMINFRRNSYESQINGYLLCLRWLLFGFTIALYLLSISNDYYHCIIAICILGLFYPNLLITSSYVLIYSLNTLDAVQHAHQFIAACIIIGWTVVPLITALIAQWLGYWAPFLLIGFLLSISILYLMCCAASNKTKAQIMRSEREEIADSDDDSVPLKTGTNDAAQSMIFEPIETEDEYEEIESVWKKQYYLLCKYNPSIMASSMGMFQISTFLLNIESFLINICLSIYLCWFCMAIHNDLDQTFLISSIQMCVTGILIIVCVVFASRYIYTLFYFYSCRMLVDFFCIILCTVMSSQYTVKYLYWILLPVIITFIVLLNMSTDLIIARNTQHGCYTFINASNQMFKLIAFIVGALCMGLLTKTDDGQNLLTFWNIITSVLSIQWSICILVTFIQGAIKCFCVQNDKM